MDRRRERQIVRERTKEHGLKDTVNSDEKYRTGGKRTTLSVYSASQRGRTGNSRNFCFLSTQKR